MTGSRALIVAGWTGALFLLFVAVASALLWAVAPSPPQPARAAARALPPAPVPPRVERTTPPPPAAAEPVGYVIRRVLDVPSPFRHGDHVWDEQHAPAAGRVVITIDLKAQTLSAFRDGYEIGSAVILYGADEKPTPLGVFQVTQKDADHVSNLYGAPMPYMLRLTNDGISIHGSASIEPAFATHGCIGVPIAFARRLFRAVRVGDRVIVTNGERLSAGQAIGAA